MNRELRRRLEALRKALASRPKAPEGLSIDEELSRWDLNGMAGVLAVMQRTGLLDRFCDDCDDGPWVNEPQTRTVWAAFSGGERMPWDVCASCDRELEAFERHSYEKPEPVVPEPELWEDETGQCWPARRCKACDRDRSTKPDSADAAWEDPIPGTPKRWEFCTGCGTVLGPCEPASRD